MNPLYIAAGLAGGLSVLASWLGLVNRGTETIDRARWYGGIVVAVLGVVLFAGAVGAALYQLAGVLPWVAWFARCLAAPLRWLLDAWASMTGGR